jgi:hypothetical protein
MTCAMDYPYSIQRGGKKIRKSRGDSCFCEILLQKSALGHQAIAFYAAANKSGVGSALDPSNWSAAPVGRETASSTGAASS